jgi:hypothetical protein
MIRCRKVTEAHFIAGTLGLSDDTPEKPQTPVHLDFPRGAPKRLFTARVILWRPAQADGEGGHAGIGEDLRELREEHH